MTPEDTAEIYGRMAALETILTCLVWRFAQSQGDQVVNALAAVMANAGDLLAEASRNATSDEEHTMRVAAEESFGRITEALTKEITKAAPEGRGH